MKTLENIAEAFGFWLALAFLWWLVRPVLALLLGAL
jgi:hypothetical protein